MGYSAREGHTTLGSRWMHNVSTSDIRTLTEWEVNICTWRLQGFTRGHRGCKTWSRRSCPCKYQVCGLDLGIPSLISVANGRSTPSSVQKVQENFVFLFYTRGRFVCQENCYKKNHRVQLPPPGSVHHKATCGPARPTVVTVS